MLLANRKKAENISEYIIYMYQTEMLIRNFEFDIEKIKIHVFGNIPSEKMSDQDKARNLDWYQSVINQMIQEGLQKEGHLNEVQDEVENLSQLSLKLLTHDKLYQSVFNNARTAIRTNIQASNGLVKNPIQACLNGVLGLLIARMNGKEIPEEVQDQLEQFGNVLSYLSSKYEP